MNSARSLIVAEAGISTEALVSHCREVSKERLCYLLTEVPLYQTVAGMSRIECVSMSDYFPPNSPVDAEMYRTSRVIFEKWKNHLDGSDIGKHVRHCGVHLLEVARFHTECRVLFQTIRKVHCLLDILRGERWSEITLLQSAGRMAAMLRCALAASEQSPSVRIVKLPRDDRGLNLKGRILNPVIDALGLQDDLAFRRALRAYRRQWSGRLGGRKERPLCAVLGLHPPRVFLDNSLAVLRSAVESQAACGIASTAELSRGLLGDQQGATVAWDQHVSPALISEVLVKRGAMRRAWRRLHSEPAFREIFVWNDIQLWPIVRRDLSALIDDRLGRNMIMAGAMTELIEDLRPRTIVTSSYSNDDLSEVALGIARLRGIPSIAVQPAMVTDHPFYHGPVNADILAVLDERSREVYASGGGIARERIAVTGFPRWDGIKNRMTSMDSVAVKSGLGLSGEERYVLLAGQPVKFEEMRRVVTAVAVELNEMGGTRLVIRPHPNEREEKYLSMIEAIDLGDFSPVITKQGDLHSIIAESELIVTLFSNVALEAAIAGKPVLVANLSGGPDVLPFVDIGVAEGAHSEQELRTKVRGFLSGAPNWDELEERRRAYFEQNPHMVIGEAAKRVVDLARQVTSTVDSSPEAKNAK